MKPRSPHLPLWWTWKLNLLLLKSSIYISDEILLHLPNQSRSNPGSSAGLIGHPTMSLRIASFVPVTYIRFGWYRLMFRKACENIYEQPSQLIVYLPEHIAPLHRSLSHKGSDHGTRSRNWWPRGVSPGWETSPPPFLVLCALRCDRLGCPEKDANLFKFLTTRAQSWQYSAAASIRAYVS